LRSKAADIVQELVAVYESIFDMQENEIIEVRLPPAASFNDVGGTIDLSAQAPHGLGTDVTLGAASVHQKNAFLDVGGWFAGNSGQGTNRKTQGSCHTTFSRFAVGADDFCDSKLSKNLRLRCRRAIFCLRSRLNLDLSPFLRDILASWVRCYISGTGANPLGVRFDFPC
jgi:hypothetical protein